MKINMCVFNGNTLPIISLRPEEKLEIKRSKVKSIHRKLDITYKYDAEVFKCLIHSAICNKN